MSLRLVIFNDPHYARQPPECRGKTYPQEILAKMHQCADLALRLEASAILCTGDWFHRKGKVTHSEQNDLLKVLSGWREKGLEVAGILGNHDIAGHSLSSLNNRAVGALVNSGALHLLDHDPLHLRSGDDEVYLTGTSYFHGCDSNDDSRCRAYGTPIEDHSRYDAFEVPEGAVHVHLAHGTLRQKGKFFEEYSEAPSLVQLLEDHDRCPDVIACGHLHFNEGIRHWKTKGGRRVTVCRAGSLGRVDRTDLDRQIMATVVAIKGRKWTAKTFPIGAEPSRSGVVETKGGELVAVNEARVQEFVQYLREEADEFALADNHKLIQTVTDELGFETEAYQVALRAVEKRQ